jgi:hypothetical protein
MIDTELRGVGKEMVFRQSPQDQIRRGAALTNLAEWFFLVRYSRQIK